MVIKMLIALTVGIISGALTVKNEKQPKKVTIRTSTDAPAVIIPARPDTTIIDTVKIGNETMYKTTIIRNITF